MSAKKIAMNLTAVATDPGQPTQTRLTGSVQVEVDDCQINITGTFGRPCATAGEVLANLTEMVSIAEGRRSTRDFFGGGDDELLPPQN